MKEKPLINLWQICIGTYTHTPTQPTMKHDHIHMYTQHTIKHAFTYTYTHKQNYKHTY